MHRGIIQLTQPEIALLLDVATKQQMQFPIVDKLKAAQANKADPTSVEANEDESEALLDSLGAPVDTDSDVLKGLRVKMQQFTYKLRSDSISFITAQQ